MVLALAGAVFTKKVNARNPLTLYATTDTGLAQINAVPMFRVPLKIFLCWPGMDLLIESRPFGSDRR